MTKQRVNPAVGAVLAALLMVGAAKAESITAFSLTSSPDSWVGQGRTLTLTPSDGFSFNGTAWGQAGLKVSLVNNAGPNNGTSYFYMEFIAPDGANLQIGHYADIATTPLNGSAFGLDFSSDGHGDSQISGSVDILEFSLNSDGSLKSFAANFLQNDEADPMRWNLGEVRYNSSIALTPLPEPSSCALMLLGLSLGGLALRKSGRIPQ